MTINNLQRLYSYIQSKTEETMKPYTYVDVNANYLNYNEEFFCREVVATTHAEQDCHHHHH